MTASDHANVETATQKLLTEKLALIASGDPAHAFHNLGKQVCKVYAPFNEIIAVVSAAVKFFRENSSLYALVLERARSKGRKLVPLRRNVETRFLSAYHMILSFLKSYLDIYDTIPTRERGSRRERKR